MPKTVRIYGMAANLSQTPEPRAGDDVWLSNSPKGYQYRLPRAFEEWTHWFNLHSRQHMTTVYPSWYLWYGKQAEPIYLQDVQPDIPNSIKFPKDEIQAYFGGPEMGSPGRYFTCTVCWLIAYAIMLGYERIELWGFMLKDKPARTHECYKFERPCFFYWVKQARDRGIEVIYQEPIERLPFEPGDPSTYTGPLYGYETT